MPSQLHNVALAVYCPAGRDRLRHLEILKWIRYAQAFTAEHQSGGFYRHLEFPPLCNLRVLCGEVPKATTKVTKDTQRSDSSGKFS